MPSLSDLLERESRTVDLEPDDFERLIRRRDRKRRNQRIAAGVVGIAVFVAAVGLVTTFGSTDRTQPAVSGGTLTGPTTTEPTFHDAVWLGGLPPEGATPSTPAEGEVVARFAEIHVGFVYVYADGRVIWHPDRTNTINEQRLTPVGVDLVLSGDVEPRRFLKQSDGSVPRAEVFDVAGAWADRRIRTYVPARFAICLSAVQVDDTYTEEETHPVDPSGVVGLFPPRAEALLRGEEQTYDHIEGPGPGSDIPPSTCYEVATEEARALDDILSHAGFERRLPTFGAFSWLSPDRPGEPISIEFAALLPQAEWVVWSG